MTQRAILPSRRLAETFDFEHAGQRFTASVGLYGDGRVGEIFLNSRRIGSGTDAVMRDCAILASFALQFGAPIDHLRKAMTRNGDGSPSSPIGALFDMLDGRGGSAG